MDTSKQYIEMCEKATEIREEYFNRGDNTLLPSFVYSKRSERVCINLWTPEILQNLLGNKYDSMNVSIDFLNDDKHDLPETDKLAIKSYVWLPSQDQLQEMIKFHHDKSGGRQTTDYSMLVELHNKSMDLFVKVSHDYEFSWSMEKLWLIHAMKLIHNKIWNGKNWVN